MYIPSVLAISGLPWYSTFDAGNTNEWNGWHSGTVSISNEQSYGNNGGYAARTNVEGGTVNNHYLEHYFGDHVISGLDKVEEAYLRFYSMFENNYVWPSSHKLAIFNITDGVSSQRRYQVFIHIGSDGRYYVEHSYIDSWRFFGLTQNVGTPATVEFNHWDKIKLYVKLNTPSIADGIIRLWINDELKMEYTMLNLRENTSFGVNKVILSSYTTFTNGGNTTQWHDSWYISETDPDTTVAPSPPVLRSID